MDIQKMIRELEDERDRLDEAIVALERLAATTRARGRPPNWRKDLASRSSATQAKMETGPGRGRRPSDLS